MQYLGNNMRATDLVLNRPLKTAITKKMICLWIFMENGNRINPINHPEGIAFYKRGTLFRSSSVVNQTLP